MSNAPPSLEAGRVGRPHGLDGSFYVTRPRPDLLAAGAELFVGERPAVIARRAGTDRHPIVRLQGVEDRDAAEALRGLPLSVAQGAAPALAENEWWAHELEGCAVVDGEQPVGTVTRLVALPSCEALEVERAGSREPLLVPMVKDAVRSVQARERRIDIDLDFLGARDDPAAARAHGGGGERDGD